MSEGEEYESSCSCAICMEELGAPIEACPCGHAYHKACIREWIHQKRICPQCKGDALPLIPLHFNLYRVDPENRGSNSSEIRSSLKLELSTVTLSIDTELAEINVLEPQLAECEAEEIAYRKGLKARVDRKRELEVELEKARFMLADLERQRKQLHEESESMRGKLCAEKDKTFSSSSIRRSIQSSEIPKVMNFIVSDSRKLREIEAEVVGLKSQLAKYRQAASDLGKKQDLVKTSIKQLPSVSLSRIDGFIPIDAIGHKRKLEEERLQELESRKPSLFENYVSQKNTKKSFESLSLLVSLLSDGEDVSELKPSAGSCSSLRTFLTQGVT